MVNTADSKRKNELKERIRVLTEFVPGIPPSFAQALRSLLTGMEYNDLTLMRSHLNSALESLVDVVNEAIQKRLGWPERMKAGAKEIWEALKNCPGENFDELGKEIESSLDKIIKDLNGFHEPIRTLREHGHEVESEAALEREIEELRSLKNSMLENWPWSTQDLPPVDRDMVTRAREAIRRGDQGERIEDLIARLGGQTAKDC